MKMIHLKVQKRKVSQSSAYYTITYEKGGKQVNVVTMAVIMVIQSKKEPPECAQLASCFAVKATNWQNKSLGLP